MKDFARPTPENANSSDVLLETIVSAHYLVLQMRLLAGADDFSGHAETELMADALSRWAQVVSAKWRDGQFDGAGLAQIQQ